MATGYRMYGFKEWNVVCSPTRFRSVLRKHMSRATELNGMVAARAQRETIQASKGLKANAALTVFIKGSNKPLVDNADLFGSITYEVVNEFTVFAGVMREDEEGFNIALALHEGFQTTVTPAMRGMFFALWKVGKGEMDPASLTGRAAQLWAARPGQWLPLSEETTVITTPGRPWVSITFADDAFKAKIASNWNQALEAVFKELANKGSGGSSKAAKAVKGVAKKARRAVGALSKVGKSLARRGKALSKAAKRAGKAAKRTGKKLSKRVKSVARRAKRALK